MEFSFEEYHRDIYRRHLLDDTVDLSSLIGICIGVFCGVLILVFIIIRLRRNEQIQQLRDWFNYLPILFKSSLTMVVIPSKLMVVSTNVGPEECSGVLYAMVPRRLSLATKSSSTLMSENDISYLEQPHFQSQSKLSNPTPIETSYSDTFSQTSSSQVKYTIHDKGLKWRRVMIHLSRGYIELYDLIKDEEERIDLQDLVLLSVDNRIGLYQRTHVERTEWFQLQHSDSFSLPGLISLSSKSAKSDLPIAGSRISPSVAAEIKQTAPCVYLFERREEGATWVRATVAGREVVSTGGGPAIDAWAAALQRHIDYATSTRGKRLSKSTPSARPPFAVYSNGAFCIYCID